MTLFAEILTHIVFSLRLGLCLGFLSLVGNIHGDDNIASAASIRVACVGDSITAVAGAPKGKSYPAQLQQILGAGWLA